MKGGGFPREAGQALNQRQPSNTLVWSQIRDITLANKQPFGLAFPERLQFFDSDLEAYFPLLWHFRHSYHLCLMLYRENTGPCCEVYALNTRNNEASRQMFGGAWGKPYWFLLIHSFGGWEDMPQKN